MRKVVLVLVIMGSFAVNAAFSAASAADNGGDPRDYQKFVRLVKGQVSRH